MIHGSDRFAELRSLIDALCEECITPDQLVRLEALLRNNPEAQEFYVHSMLIHARLAREFAGVAEWTTQAMSQNATEISADSHAKVDARSTILRAVRRSWRTRWLTAVACVAAACLAVLLVDATNGGDFRQTATIRVGMPEHPPLTPGPPAEMHRPMLQHRHEMESLQERGFPG